jgi:hypothetical protein
LLLPQLREEATIGSVVHPVALRVGSVPRGLHSRAVTEVTMSAVTVAASLARALVT